MTFNITAMTPQEASAILADYKSKKKTAQLALMNKYGAGIKTRKEFEAWLTAKTVTSVSEDPHLVKSTTTSRNHYIYVLDVSGSMQSRIDVALQGLILNVEYLPEDSKVTLIEFSNSIITKVNAGSKDEALGYLNTHNRLVGGKTALFDAVKECVNHATLNSFPSTENKTVAVFVFTDGAENASSINQREFKNNIAWFIEKNVVLAFMADSRDKGTLLSNGVPEGNINTHENTNETIKKSFETTKINTVMLSKAIEKGDNETVRSLSVNFYKTIEK